MIFLKHCIHTTTAFKVISIPLLNLGLYYLTESKDLLPNAPIYKYCIKHVIVCCNSFTNFDYYNMPNGFNYPFTYLN